MGNMMNVLGVLPYVIPFHNHNEYDYLSMLGLDLIHAGSFKLIIT